MERASIQSLDLQKRNVSGGRRVVAFRTQVLDGKLLHLRDRISRTRSRDSARENKLDKDSRGTEGKDDHEKFVGGHGRHSVTLS